MNKSYISLKFIAIINACRTHNIESSNTMNTIFSTTTKNFDTIQIIETADGWYEVYFNNAFISQNISLSMAYCEVESQQSL